MHALRKYLSWIFALTFLISLPITFNTTLQILNSFREYQRPTYFPITSRVLLIVVPFVMPLITTVFGIAWRTVFQEKRSARVWGIAASLINVQVALFPLLIPPHSLPDAGFLLILGLGLVGLIVFAWPMQPPDSVVPIAEAHRIPGDGTSSFINKGLPLFTTLAFLGAYSWWLRWVRNNYFSAPDFITGTLTLALVGLLIVALHESGHTLVGILVGMKLRAFIVGPFQWRIREGKWEFHFELRQILATSGATGVVPTSSDFPDRARLCMLTAGVFTNTATGLIALWLAVAGVVPLQIQSVFALFGIFSMVIAAVNLVPFRTGENYSDGAQIYQLLSNGPWADFHRIVGLAGSSLVSPVRPRDYDITAIQRTAEVIGQGRQGLLLRLLGHCYFLDCGDLAGAGEELVKAGAIYNTSAPNTAVEQVTAFVFGSAYIWRSAETARQWWAHVEAKKPTELNADYWLAVSALHWVEGETQRAIESLDKAETLAQQLPKAGAYEFERYLCSLLRQSLDRVPVTA